MGPWGSHAIFPERIPSPLHFPFSLPSWLLPHGTTPREIILDLLCSDKFFFQIVFDYDGSKKGPPECEVIDKSYPFATCLLEWDFDQKCLVVRHAMPRKYPLRIKNIKDRFIQGKSMNQV